MGRAPLTVTFSDLSFNDPSGWYWDFGDGNTSTVKNPVHTFEGPGVYTVSLVVENAYGNSTTSRDVYVR
jgi:PKD repeat protein